MNAILLTMLINTLPVDKAAHFGIGGTVQAMCTALTNAAIKDKTTSNIACFTAVTALSIGKEIIDPYNGGQRDKNDALAGILGGLAVGLTIQIGF